MLWWKRWRAAAIGGIALAFVLHITVAMIAVWVLGVVVEAISGRFLGLTRSSAEVEADQQLLRLDDTVTAQVGKGSSTFTDLTLPRRTLRMTVTGPQMLVSGLRLVTDLGILEGHDHPHLVELADDLRAVSYCGRTEPTETDIEVVVDRQGPALRIDAGPASMYESVIEISARNDETLEDLLDRTIGSGTGRGYLVGLVPIAAAGHIEHDPVTPEHAPATNIDDATGEELSHGHA